MSVKSSKFSFEGGKALEAALRAIGKEATARSVAEKALMIAAEPIAQKARELAPVDKGNLRESIKVAKKANYGRGRKGRSRGDTVYAFVGIDGSVLPPKDAKTRRNKRKTRFLQAGGGVAAYSIFKEYGTSSMPAEPYMRPAFEAKKQAAVDAIGPALWEEIAKAARRAAKKGK
jgi:HK97 gp10 family phage protein